MAKGKKAKKGKDKDKAQLQLTTLPILKARTTVLCPRLGDAYALTNKVTQILEETALQVIHRASMKQLNTINLNTHKLYQLNIPTELIPGLSTMTAISLSKNNLFDSASVFNVIVKCFVYWILSRIDFSTVTSSYSFEPIGKFP